ncbi:single-stranded DNA-binding protein [Actinomadura hibisca]|uniref:single-stranded DNA-binding protein n=1 Tax=Actinomadura hibisca TaxID=68565 RepID=UPI00082EC532|nr:single-stranded DNA-binding protein [Actinomadura hibisca]
MNETEVTLVGNLVDDPDLNFITTGKAVSKVRVASTSRYVGRDGQWTDGARLFLTCSTWGPYGEHVAETLRRGDEVIVKGRLKQRSYETKSGEKRTVFEVDVSAIGPTLRKGSAVINRIQRTPSAPSPVPAMDETATPWNVPSTPVEPWPTPTPAGAGQPAAPPL